MELPETIRGRFVRRDNRFRVTVDLAGELVAAHLPNSGRLGELLVPGRPCYLAHVPSKHRRTAYDLLLVDYEGQLVSVDSRLPNQLFAEAIALERLAPFAGVTAAEREVHHGDSRLDFRLTDPSGAFWVEVKSVTLVERGTAMFPDAPTERGRRHLGELVDLVKTGARAAAVFVIQRRDAKAFTPHAEADPAFAKELRTAKDAGVGVYAFGCRVQQREIYISDRVPVLFD